MDIDTIRDQVKGLVKHGYIDKKKINKATPNMDNRKTVRCRFVENGFFLRGTMTSWINILPHECK